MCPVASASANYHIQQMLQINKEKKSISKRSPSKGLKMKRAIITLAVEKTLMFDPKVYDFSYDFFLYQIQHGLESQISALVSNLQVLQQHQSMAKEKRQRDQEVLIQEQIQSRLTRLEEAQKQLLELQVGHW